MASEKTVRLIRSEERNGLYRPVISGKGEGRGGKVRLGKGKKKKKAHVQLRPRGISSRSHLQKNRKRLGEVCTLRYCPGLQLLFHRSSCWLSRVVWIRHTLSLSLSLSFRIEKCDSLCHGLSPRCRLLTELLCGSVEIETISSEGHRSTCKCAECVQGVLGLRTTHTIL